MLRLGPRMGASSFGPVVGLGFTGGVLPTGAAYTGNGGLGTRTNAAGAVVASVANVVRFDYSGATPGVPLGVLVEPARTNLALQSAAADSVTWTKDGATVTANAIAAPDGTTSADKLVETATTAEHRIYQSIAAVAAQPYAWSAYFKAAERSWVAIRSSGAVMAANFNLATGALGTVKAGTTATITNAGNGWYRCTIAGELAAAAEFFVINMGDADTGTGASYAYVGNAANGLYFWGAQMELSAVPAIPTTLIPTADATVTRTADALSFTIPPPVATLRYVFGDDTRQDVAVTPGAYTVPTNLNRAQIKTIISL